MSNHVLMDLLNSSFENDKNKGLRSFYHFQKMNLINSIKHDHECEILFIT